MVPPSPAGYHYSWGERQCNSEVLQGLLLSDRFTHRLQQLALVEPRVHAACAQVMTIWGLGGGVGVIGGGAIGQWLHNRRRAHMPLFVGACVAAAALPIWFLINADVGAAPLPVSFVAGFLGGALASPPGPNARSSTPPGTSTASPPASLKERIHAVVPQPQCAIMLRAAAGMAGGPCGVQ